MGVSCIILRNVTIGPNSIVGTGSVVTKNVPAGVVVAGNPAKFVKTVEEYKKGVLAEWDKQRPVGYFVGERHSKYPAEQVQKLKERNRPLLVEHLKRLFNE
jgi:carbonic anhydrase/acetyltransferase-like protein (isoleucine patch superfamily)